MLSFHINVHVQPPQAQEASEVVLLGEHFRTLRVPQEALSLPFGISFEEAGSALSKLERMFFEPDGSFVWTSSGGGGGGAAWQVEGNLFDRADRLLFVDLKGTCREKDFDRLLGAFGWPKTPLVFQLVREAVFLSEKEFRRHAARKAAEKSTATKK